MQVIDHSSEPLEAWRPGVETRMRVSALTGSSQITIFDQWCQPGLGAPMHSHPVEEVLSVVAGEAEIWLGGSAAIVTAGKSVVVAAGMRHGFRNCGSAVLVMQAVLAAPFFEAVYEGSMAPVRRWEPSCTR